MKVVLTRRWHGQPNRVPGDEIEVDERVGAFLVKVGGAASPEDYKAAQKPERPAKVGGDPVVDEEPQVAVEETVTRPARAASIDVWRKWAQAQGFEVKGLSKQELIALR